MRSVVLLLLLGACAAAQAAQFHSLTVSRNGKLYSMAAEVYLDAPVPDVYRVLTDYDHLNRISGAVRKSYLVRRVDAMTAVVYTESRVCVLFFCHTIQETQTVTETPPTGLHAEIIPAESNVKVATSIWHLQADGTGTLMQWSLSVEPEFWIPPLIGPALMKGALRSEGEYSAHGIEKLARQWAHLPSLSAATRAPAAQTH
ncbi:MAG: SRPBCC family protein [Gammaproteobacteria bacterium]